MSQFFQELWESIFTPGPTPSLLIATNVTFAVLQVVLFVLLIATYSVHFIVLSFLSGSLWWAINWFARELETVRAEQRVKEEEQKRMDRRRAVVAAATASRVSTDSETEVEENKAAKNTATGRSLAGDVRQRATATSTAKATSAPIYAEGKAAETEAPRLSQPRAPAAAASLLAVGATVGAVTQGSHGSQGEPGNIQLSGCRSGVSTEDEWEKVSENEQ